MKQPGGASVWRRRGRRALRVGAAVYLGLCLVLYLLQTWMIFPGHATQGTREADVRPMPGEALVRLSTRGGDRTVALFGAALGPDGKPRADAARRPTIIFFYGNGMCVRDSAGEFDAFRRLGANVLVPEFVGYGMAGGKPSEVGVYATADAAYDHLLTRADIDPRWIVPVGRSLGSAAAIDLASRRPVAGVATFSAFTSMGAMARKVLPLFPASLLLRHKFYNDRKLPLVACPIFLAHGTNDSLVPFTMMGQLQALAKAPVTRAEVSGADHNDVIEVGGAELMAKFGAFLESTAPPAE